MPTNMQDLNSLFSTSFGDHVRAREAFATEQAAKQATTKYNDALTLESQFRTKKGEALLPYETRQQEFETSPKMQEAKLLKSQSEAKQLKLAVDKMEDEQVLSAVDQQIGNQETIVNAFSSIITANPTIETGQAIDMILSKLPEDIANDPKLTKVLEQYRNLPPTQALALAKKALDGIAEAKAKRDPAYWRDLIKSQWDYKTAQVRANAGGGGGSADGMSSDKYMVELVKQLYPNNPMKQAQAIQVMRQQASSGALPKSQTTSTEFGDQGITTRRETVPQGQGLPPQDNGTPGVQKRTPLLDQEAIAAERAKRLNEKKKPTVSNPEQAEQAYFKAVSDYASGALKGEDAVDKLYELGTKAGLSGVEITKSITRMNQRKGK